MLIFKNLNQIEISAAKIHYFVDKNVACNNSKQMWDVIATECIRHFNLE